MVVEKVGDFAGWNWSLESQYLSVGRSEIRKGAQVDRAPLARTHDPTGCFLVQGWITETRHLETVRRQPGRDPGHGGQSFARMGGVDDTAPESIRRLEAPRNMGGEVVDHSSSRDIYTETGFPVRPVPLRCEDHAVGGGGDVTQPRLYARYRPPRQRSEVVGRIFAEQEMVRLWKAGERGVGRGVVAKPDHPQVVAVRHRFQLVDLTELYACQCRTAMSADVGHGNATGRETTSKVERHHLRAR